MNAPAAKPRVAMLADYGARDLYDDGVVVRAHRNESALPPPEHVVEALRSIDVDLLRNYPSALQSRSIAALAKRLGVDPSCIVLGNGADDILAAVTNAFVAPGDCVVTVTPTFGMYARNVAVAGGELRTLPYLRRWELDVDRLVALADERTKLVILGHPNNPTGEPLSPQALTAIARALPGVLIAIDEVYLTFSDASLLAVAQNYENVAIVGSLSKVGALAGMRVGYAAAAPEVSAALRRVMPPFPIGAASLVAAEAYASGGAATDAFERALAAQVERSLDAIVSAIARRARTIWRGPSNFVLADFGDDAEPLERRLREAGIAVRSFSGPEMAGCLRFCALDDASTAALVEAFDA
jgi:histidinol-phosphate aminotransferase